ncbi:MAG: hypothetical protein H8D87_02610 [Deltaproteobacteria bacterium]|uniref:tautomerase family protein n=1 Tax=Desulfobacula sp. TaxID=2593537 RepID=UPI0019A57A30|nr:hypothetical protein [Candidatus Desulfobacula maris]MBL6994229.1 hypothetical protein [Desulfobacula sp.]
MGQDLHVPLKQLRVSNRKKARCVLNENESANYLYINQGEKIMPFVNIKTTNEGVTPEKKAELIIYL